MEPRNAIEILAYEGGFLVTYDSSIDFNWLSKFT